MDASSSLSNYPLKDNGSSVFQPVSDRNKVAALYWMIFFPPSLNSEEAKSTTWLHPVSGEAVITGHRKSPGKVSLNGWQVSPVTVCHVRRHALLFLPVSPPRYFPQWVRERGGKSEPTRARIAALLAPLPREPRPLSRLFSRWSLANLWTCKNVEFYWQPSNAEMNFRST